LGFGIGENGRDPEIRDPGIANTIFHTAYRISEIYEKTFTPSDQSMETYKPIILCEFFGRICRILKPDRNFKDLSTSDY